MSYKKLGHTLVLEGGLEPQDYFSQVQLYI
jgi:hypothetical protein